MNYYLDVLKKYVVFSGRARRQEFWMFVLINFAVSIVVGIIDSVVGAGGLLSGLYSLAVLLPVLGLAARRLHDTDKSGWWLLLYLIPVLGWIVLIVFWATEGQPNPNQYGPSPKAVHA
ncbi:DUF805 domain-containing protein [Streptomyces sp. NPDC002812]|uniref:DUF805 domain-containing protein n=1 Tax=unclassified Streptomyces TaxID=2593676 RepID=UPI0022539456|nr:DUF805 domain-containing protein [Streptomyces sp. NBC_00347]MCX5127996.1 DUF805 domain-containing protein [Streptomyces sp. NBC_00347]